MLRGLGSWGEAAALPHFAPCLPALAPLEVAQAVATLGDVQPGLVPLGWGDSLLGDPVGRWPCRIAPADLQATALQESAGCAAASPVALPLPWLSSMGVKKCSLRV